MCKKLHVREVCHAHCVYGRNVYGIICRENMSDINININVRVREVNSDSEVRSK